MSEKKESCCYVDGKNISRLEGFLNRNHGTKSCWVLLVLAFFRIGLKDVLSHVFKAIIVRDGQQRLDTL